MQKIISLYQRNYETDRLVRDEVVPGAEWVVNGEGIATRKLDGTCCMISVGVFYKRYEVKKGKIPPEYFIPAGDIDLNTGKWQGWLPVGDGSADQYHRIAYREYSPVSGIVPKDGTYELLGPKVQGNPEGCRDFVLMKHGCIEIDDVPRKFKALKKWLAGEDIEGVVWHHPDGRMVKIKKKDFGLKR